MPHLGANSRVETRRGSHIVPEERKKRPSCACVCVCVALRITVSLDDLGVEECAPHVVIQTTCQDEALELYKDGARGRLLMA